MSAAGIAGNEQVETIHLDSRAEFERVVGNPTFCCRGIKMGPYVIHNFILHF